MSRTRPVLRGVRRFCALYEDISASAKERIYAAAEREGDASDGEARRGRGGFASEGGDSGGVRSWRPSRRPQSWGQRAPKAKHLS